MPATPECVNSSEFYSDGLKDQTYAEVPTQLLPSLRKQSTSTDCRTGPKPKTPRRAEFARGKQRRRRQDRRKQKQDSKKEVEPLVRIDQLSAVLGPICTPRIVAYSDVPVIAPKPSHKILGIPPAGDIVFIDPACFTKTILLHEKILINISKCSHCKPCERLLPKELPSLGPKISSISSISSYLFKAILWDHYSAVSAVEVARNFMLWSFKRVLKKRLVFANLEWLRECRKEPSEYWINLLEGMIAILDLDMKFGPIYFTRSMRLSIIRLSYIGESDFYLELLRAHKGHPKHAP